MISAHKSFTVGEHVPALQKIPRFQKFESKYVSKQLSDLY